MHASSTSAEESRHPERRKINEVMMKVAENMAAEEGVPLDRIVQDLKHIAIGVEKI